jgi:hypothetical protein
MGKSASQERKDEGRKFVWVGDNSSGKEVWVHEEKERGRKRVGSGCGHGEWILEKDGMYLENFGAEY